VKARTIREWLLAHALWLGVLWGFAEGTLFFIVPDVLITLIALFSVRRSLWCLLAALAGAVAAGMLMYGLATVYPEPVRAMVNGVPFVNDWMFDAVEQAYQQSGALALALGPLAGIPFKLYAALAPEHLGLGWFIPLSILARLERFFITWAAFALIGYALRHRADQYVGRILLGHLGFWSAVCLYYWAVVVDG